MSNIALSISDICIIIYKNSYILIKYLTKIDVFCSGFFYIEMLLKIESFILFCN